MRYLARLYLIGFSGQLEVDLSGISCFDRAFPHTSPVVSGGFQIRLETIEGPASPVGLRFHYWLLNSQACRLLSSLRIWPPIAKLPGSSLTGEPLGNSASASKNSGGIGAEYVLVIVLTRSIGQSMAHEYIQGHRHIGIWRETRRDCTRHPTSQYPFHRCSDATFPTQSIQDLMHQLDKEDTHDNFMACGVKTENKWRTMRSCPRLCPN